MGKASSWPKQLCGPQLPLSLLHPATSGHSDCVHHRECLQHLEERNVKIAHSDGETLLGPALVGVYIGVLVAACAIAFGSEYGRGTLLWQRALDVMFSLVGGFLLTFVPFGLAPVLIGRSVRAVKKR